MNIYVIFTQMHGNIVKGVDNNLLQLQTTSRFNVTANITIFLIQFFTGPLIALMPTSSSWYVNQNILFSFLKRKSNSSNIYLPIHQKIYNQTFSISIGSAVYLISFNSFYYLIKSENF